MPPKSQSLVLSEEQLRAMKPKHGEPTVTPCPYASITQADIDLAASEGNSPEHRRARKAVAGYYYLSTQGLLPASVADSKQKRQAVLQDELKGIDLSKPVEIVKLPPPDKLVQHVRTGKKARPGRFFDPLGNQHRANLGINPDKKLRRRIEFTADKESSITGLRSTAAPIIDTWTDPKNPIETKGGGEQLMIPSVSLGKLESELDEK